MNNIAESPAPLANRIPDACRRLGVGRSSLYELIKSGDLRTIKIGTRTLVPESELQRIITERMQVEA